MATRWGILSAGAIASDFVKALSVEPAGHCKHQVVAVAARDQQRAQIFASKHKIEKAYGDYASLATDPEVEVGYVGSITPAHKDLVKLLLQSGKSVVCEKPMGLNSRETAEMVNLAREKNLFLMEAMWSWFLPSFLNLKKQLSNGLIGKPIKVAVDFCDYVPIPRYQEKELGGGVILNLGVYAAYFARLAFNGEDPIKNVAAGHLNAEGIDDDVTAHLEYEDGKTAVIMMSSKVVTCCDATVYGTKGFLHLPFPWWCSPLLVSHEEKHEFQISGLQTNYENSAGLAYEAQHVRECLLKGLKESPIVTLDDSLAIAKVLESWHEQVGVTFPHE